MFWEAEAFAKRELIGFARKNDQPRGHTAYRSFVTNVGMMRPAARIEGVDVLQDWVKSVHLDPAIIDAMPTYTVGHQIAVLQPDGSSYGAADTPAFEPDSDEFVDLYEAATRDPSSTITQLRTLGGR